jgi:dipeptidyl aminopeptidase/acylaminoacyl peptidase
MWTGQLLVSAGYAVVYPDLAERPDPSEDLADRILSVIDAAAGSALIDRDRIGLWGLSFGAWAAVLAAAQSDRIDAVVALNGPYDRLSTLGTTSVRARMDGGMQAFATDNARWLETGQAGMAATYWDDPERYRRNSAIELADRITAPVLILSGEMDFGIAQGELLFGALNRLDRRAALITFFGEEHGLVSPGNISQMHAQVLGWFDRYLREDAASTPAAIASDEARPPPGPN